MALHEFLAGKCQRRSEDSNFVDPQPGRGLVSLKEEDGLLHFYWKNLENGQVVDDLIIFPGDATFQSVAPRVHALKFSSSNHRHFFWHQSTNPADDVENARKVNALINGEDAEDSEEMEVEAPQPAAAPAPPAAVPATGGLETQDFSSLQGLLDRFRTGGAGGAYGAPAPPPYSLLDVLLPAPSSHLSALPASLFPPSLPDSSRANALTSPSFRAAVRSLDRALESRAEGVGFLLRELGLEVGEGGVQGFVEGVRKQVKENKDAGAQ